MALILMGILCNYGGGNYEKSFSIHAIRNVGFVFM
jgi:hypothetical protein